MPRLEPFSPGQVYNLSRTSRIHVLPSPSSNTSASAHTGGSNFHLNTSMTGMAIPVVEFQVLFFKKTDDEDQNLQLAIITFFFSKIHTPSSLLSVPVV